MSDIFFLIDESYERSIGRFSLGLVIIGPKEKDLVSRSLTSLKNQVQRDQYVISKKKQENSFHYTDDSIEIRSKYIELLRTHHFKCFMAFKSSGESYAETYRCIFYKLLKDRISKYFDSNITIIFENNPLVKLAEITLATKNIQKELKKLNPGFPTSHITVEEGTKDNILLSLPDYMLGLLRDYLGENPQPFKISHFERYRGKIRLVIDLDNQNYYSASNPI